MTPKASPFVIFSLPRSRTAWLSQWLTYGPQTCGHDEVIGRSSVSELAGHLRSLAGSVETGAVIGWRALRAALPESRFLVLRRDPTEVIMSLHRAGIPYTEELLLEISARDAMLDQLSAEPGVTSIDYGLLGTAGVACWLMEELLGVEFCPDRWHRMEGLNIQINLLARMASLQRHEAGLLAIREEVSRGPRVAGLH